MAAVAPLEKPGAETARRAEPAVPVEPAGVQSLHAQGEPGKTLGLSLRRGHGQLSRKVDGSIAVAALTPISETRRDVNQAPGRHFELLSDQGSLRRSRGGEREYSHVDQSRPRLSESRLPAVEGQADGRDKRRIHRRSHPQESSLKWPICRILAQSHNVEDAYDVAPSTISNIKGFGPPMRATLLACRSSLELTFQFDPNRGIDPRDARAIEQEMNQRRADAIRALANGHKY